MCISNGLTNVAHFVAAGLKVWWLDLLLLCWSQQQCCCVSGLVFIVKFHCIRAGKQSQRITSHPGQLSLAIPSQVGAKAGGNRHSAGP